MFGAWLRQALLWAGPLYVLAGFVFLLYAASVLIGLPIIILKLDRNKAPADILGGYAGLTSVAITGLVPLTMLIASTDFGPRLINAVLLCALSGAVLSMLVQGCKRMMNENWV